MECGRAAGKHDNKLSAEANLPQDGEADACSQYSVVFNFNINVPQNLQYSGFRFPGFLQTISGEVLWTITHSRV